VKIPFIRDLPALSADSLTRAHARFVRAALAIYATAAAVAVTILIVSITEDRTHDERQTQANLLLQTQVQAFYLGKQLAHLGGEMTRLGLRSEVDLLDQNLAPEESLLNLTHAKSAFFTEGLAILGLDGAVLSAEPQKFLAAGTSFATQPWFEIVKNSSTVRLVPVEPERAEDALLYVVAPIVRNQEFTGALLGAIDLARAEEMDAASGSKGNVLIVLATHNGKVVYPPKPPAFSEKAEWKTFFDRTTWEPVLSRAELSSVETVIAAAGVPDTDLVLMSLAGREILLSEAHSRMITRIILALSFVLTPLAVLVMLLRRSLRILRAAEEKAMREERLRLLGEAANLIAHEIKNSLNGFRIGLELLVRGGRSQKAGADEKIVAGLRTQIEAMSNFTSELLIFSKGVSPRPVGLDLDGFVRKVADLSRDAALDLGVALEVAPPGPEVRVTADPSLLHVILSNLLGNAFDAVSGNGAAPSPRVGVEVGASERLGWVRVADNGPGVAAAIQASLFEPFVSGKPSGVGIGLALSKKIARAHGGDLVLENALAGASFLLTLPKERT